jgi:pilus assembly protein Flp/PilA
MLKLISKSQANIANLKNKFIQDDDGATAIEYGLIAVGIALAIVAVTVLVGDDLLAAFNDVSTGLGGAGNATR